MQVNGSTLPTRAFGGRASRTRVPLRLRLLCVSAPFVAAAAIWPQFASADSLDLGTLANYALVDLGNGTTLGQNSGPVAGNELLGNGVTANFSGGNNGGLTNGGILYYDSTVHGQNTFSMLQNPPTTSEVSTTVTNTALSKAQSVSSYAAGLTATQNYSDIVSGQTIMGNGGLNVIDVANIQNAAFTIKGGPNDVFVFDVSGEFQTNQAMTLSGVLPSQILFNFTGTSGAVFQTSGGDSLYGTFLATDGGQFQFSNLVLNGELINTGGNVQLVSGSGIQTFTPFTPSTSVPLPAILPCGLLLLGGAFAGRKLRTVR